MEREFIRVWAVTVNRVQMTLRDIRDIRAILIARRMSNKHGVRSLSLALPTGGHLIVNGNGANASQRHKVA